MDNHSCAYSCTSSIHITPSSPPPPSLLPPSSLPRSLPSSSLPPLSLPPCSEVYCYGPLLETVQRADLYNDSKTFVDKPMRVDPAEVLNAFISTNLTVNSTKDEIRAFVEQYFLEAGSELVEWTPSDWTDRLDLCGVVSVMCCLLCSIPALLIAYSSVTQSAKLLSFHAQ